MIIAKVTEELSSQKEEEADQSKKVYFMAYERLEEKSKYMYENAYFWKYTPSVNFNTMAIELMNSTQPEEFLILKKLINMSKDLSLVAYLPIMIKFINFLQGKYFKSLFKHYAYSRSIKDILMSKTIDYDWSQQDVEKIISSFQAVWSKFKFKLTEYIKENISKLQAYSLDLNFAFDMDTKLSSFLPALYGDGLIVYVMIHYLSSIHNEILSLYYKNKLIEWVFFWLK